MPIEKTSLRFPRKMRIKKKQEFQMFRDCERLAGSYLCCNIKHSPSLSKVGITASRKYGTAVERNRFKRMVREAFRRLSPTLKTSILLHVIPRQRAKKAKMHHLLDELSSFVGKYNELS